MDEGPKISYPDPFIQEFTSEDEPPYYALKGITAEDQEGLDENFIGVARKEIHLTFLDQSRAKK